MSSPAHEDFRRLHHVPVASERSFGLLFVAIFAVVALLPLRHHGEVRTWALAISIVLLAVSLIRPQLLRPANHLWFRFSLLLNKIVSPVAMGVIFFLVATPTGLILRLMGKDSLRLRYDPAAKTYWQERKPAGPAPETIANQF